MTHVAPAPPIERVVLDTNAVLDWLVFGNAACAGWGERLASGRAQWLVTEPMRTELALVLDRDALRGRGIAAEAVWEVWSRLATPCPPAGSVPADRLRCTDPSDQMFIDLAIAHRAQWLVSRDRAVLKLARRARAYGLAIVTPEAWTTPTPVEQA